jgi:hypothetical protein
MANERPLTEMGIGSCHSLYRPMLPWWYYSLHQGEEQDSPPSAKLSSCLFGSFIIGGSFWQVSVEPG